MIKKILAIESSCDETAASVASFNTDDKNSSFKILSSAVSSQIKIHKATKGVVPEVAARAHIQKILPVVKSALQKAQNLKVEDLDFIAVTYGPGLAPSLLVGSEFAKGLALASRKPLIKVNHMHGHLYSTFINHPEIKLPSINLIVSGGHTYLVYLEKKNNEFKYKVIGQTVDDAAGEAFDKIAKMTGLSYPGGPAVSMAALKGKKDYGFPRPMMHDKNYDFSFSGLKTAVLYRIAEERLDIKNAQTQADISLSFENAAVEVLVRKTIRAAKEFGAKSVTISGGVAANKKLRFELEKSCKSIGVDFYFPEFNFCTDNAAMIANAAVIMIRSKKVKPTPFTSFKVDPTAEI